MKLWQFDLADRMHTRIDTNTMSFSPDAHHSGLEVMQLFHNAHEDVRLERWSANTTISLEAPYGIEILVLGGSFDEGAETFERQSLLRLPEGSKDEIKSGPLGARVWIKRGHLRETPKAPRIE